VAGRIVVRLKGSDPFMIGRGGDDEVADAGLQPPALIVVGAVVGLRDKFQWFEQTREGRPAVDRR
jgi:siroheme synthase